MKIKKYGDIFWFIISLLLILMGIYLIVEDKAILSRNQRFQKDTVYGGYFLIILGAIFSLVWFYTISPFSSFRKFFEGGKKQKK